MTQLQRPQNSVQSQCDDDWDHSYGIKIETLDNPGWSVKIDLHHVEPNGRPFVPISRNSSDPEAERIVYKTEDQKLAGYVGANNLSELLNVFVVPTGV